jgi:hypothetical protein
VADAGTSWWIQDSPPVVNVWDGGSIGNYWSNYNGSDSNLDEIGEAPYVINEENQDNYPLMSPVNIFDAGTWEWIPYSIFVMGNSTVSDFRFNPESALIQYDVDGENGTTGFCRVTIPKDLLTTEANWTVLVEGTSVTPIVNEDAKNTYIHLTYNHSTKTVEIIGTDAIPEFPSWIIPPLFLVMLSVIVVKKKLILDT